jgi:(p)ppGpp synthase/HD superfamily hydrolase
VKNLTYEDYEKALAFATQKHKGQYRIGGDEYISHPIAVSEMVKEKGYGMEYIITGLFHDLLEDTDATAEEIEEIGGSDVLEAVKLLTKYKGYNMEDYVKGIRSNDVAFAVKSADRLHNLRSALLADEDFKRRYILETVDWYLDFSPEIREATLNLTLSLKRPLTQLSFLYDLVDTWKI